MPLSWAKRTLRKNRPPERPDHSDSIHPVEGGRQIPEGRGKRGICLIGLKGRESPNPFWTVHPVPSHSDEALEQLRAFQGEKAFRVELNAVERPSAVPDSHD